jgi:hypothetical protein
MGRPYGYYPTVRWGKIDRGMKPPHWLPIVLGALALATLALPVTARGVTKTAPAVFAGPTPRALCGPGSLAESPKELQGRVPPSEVASGRAAKGYTCNTALLSHVGTTGGYRVHRYHDTAGHECAFYDSTLLFPKDLGGVLEQGAGVVVLDMKDPARPVRTANLTTAAMDSPHESLSLNAARGLLAADLGNPITYPSAVDIYDVNKDCRHPVLKSSLPIGGLGHEGSFSPDGRTFWVASPVGNLAAIDVSNPALPMPLWSDTNMHPHGLNISDDGNTVYYADLGADVGLQILDVSQIQSRRPNPQVRRVSHLTWDTVSIPQTPIPVRINGHPYLVEVDEFASTGHASSGISGNPTAKVGAARIIDIADPRQPAVISNIRLDVQMPAGRMKTTNDTGANNFLQGYTGHYCAVPRRDNPRIVACSMILSGMRVFDIQDPRHPHEIAYFNAPVHKSSKDGATSSYAMSAPAFAPGRGEVWYTDGNSGFYAIRLTNGMERLLA